MNAISRKIIVQVESRFHKQATEFLTFLRRTSRSHSVDIAILGRIGQGIELSVSANELDKITTYFYSLVVNRGVYYYLSSMKNPRNIARVVVEPIFRALLEWCFEYTSPSSIRRHILHGSAAWVAGEFKESMSHRYEILWYQLQLKTITGYEFIRDLDDLLTEFMLSRLGHSRGTPSPKFNILVDQCGRRQIIWDKEVRKRFNLVHSLRTKGLHRMEREIPDAQLAQIGFQFYNTFQYLEDYWDAQREKTILLSGKRYRRIRYGKEVNHWKWTLPKDFAETWKDVVTRPCHDCEVRVGELHLGGCDMECCPRCGGQYLCCECRTEEDEDKENEL
jgi:hypothetical protein